MNYHAGSAAAESFVKLFEPQIKTLARVSQLVRVDHSATKQTGADQAQAVIPISHPPLEFRISLQGLVNVEEETKRLKKEIDRIDSDLNHVRNKLSQETFLAKAPRELVEKERQKEKEFLAKKSELGQAMDRLQKLK